MRMGERCDTQKSESNEKVSTFGKRTVMMTMIIHKKEYTRLLEISKVVG